MTAVTRKNRKTHKKTKNSQAALFRLIGRTSLDPRWCSAPGGAQRHQLVCREVTSRCRVDCVGRGPCMHRLGSIQIDSTLRLLSGPQFGILLLGELSMLKKWPYGCEGIRSCRAVTNVSGTVPRVVETVGDKQVPTEKTTVTNTPTRPHTRTPAHPYGYPHECRGLWFQIFNLRNSNLKLKLLTRRLRKTNSALKNDTTNVTHQTKNCTTSFVAH